MQSLEDKLEIIEAALDHFYDTDVDTLLSEYKRYLDRKQDRENALSHGPVEREQAIAYFGTVPLKCKNNMPLEMKQEMLGALSEEELMVLCAEQTNTYPEMETEIQSMFDFCLKMKAMM